jgi:hypothetical protein
MGMAPTPLNISTPMQPGVQDVQTDTTTGANQSGKVGVAGQKGPAPDPAKMATTMAAVGSVALMESILSMMPPMSQEDEDVVLAEIEAKMKETLCKTDVEAIKNKQNEKLAMLQQKTAQDQASEKKLQEAHEAQQNASIWDKVRLAFQILAAVIAVVVAVVAIATGVGAPMGVLLVAGAIVAVTMAIDSITQEATPDHLGIAGELRLASDHSDHSQADKLKDAQKADEIFSYTMMAVGFAVAVATVVAAPMNIADAATQASKMAMKVGDVVTGVVDGLGAASGVGAAVYSYDATKDQADALKTQSQSTALKGAMKELDAFIDTLIKHLQGVQQTFDDVLDALVDAAKDKNKTAMHGMVG